MKRLAYLLATLIIVAPLSGAQPVDELWNAAKKGDVQTIKDLLSKGVDVNAKNAYGATALSFAADKGHLEVVQLLVEQGADINVKDTFYGATPLVWAADNGHVKVVQYLIETGATDAKDALTGAIYGEKTEMAKAILEKAKLTPDELTEVLQIAVQENKTEIIDLLKKAGASLPAGVQVPPARLHTYSGAYRNESGTEVVVSVQDNHLYLKTFGGEPFAATAESETKFKAPGFSMTFVEKDGKITGFQVLRQDGSSSLYNRIEMVAEDTTSRPRSAGNEIEAAASSSFKTAGKWPSFRGLNARGVADGENPPIKWDAEKSENIKWKTSIPGLAHSSPVIWEDKLFITTAISSDPDSKLRHGLYGDVTPHKDVSKHTWKVYCLEKKTGKIVWDRVATVGTPEVKRHPKSTHANSTPATDGKHVAVLFGTGDLLVYDFNGKLLWKKDLGILNSGWFYDPDYEWGYGSSPVIYKNLVIVQCDLHQNSFIAAFDVSTGKQVWLTPREEIPSWGSPTVYEGRDHAELITNGTKFIRGYDPGTGKELWRLAGNSEITVPTPFVADDLIYVTSGYSPIQPIYAIRPGASGDISLKQDEESNSHVAWSKKRGGPYLPTPIVYGDYLYTCGNNGVVTCYNAKTGERLYQQRLGGGASAFAFTASPVAADGRIYFTSEDGEIFVVKAGPKFELIATNKMKEVILATPAISSGMLIVRAQGNVYGIGEK